MEFGILGVIAIMVVGIQYLTASGSVDRAVKARTRLVNMIIGLAMYITIFGIYSFLMPAGKLGMSVLTGSEETCPDETSTSISVIKPDGKEIGARGSTPSTDSGEQATTAVASAGDLPIKPLDANSTSIPCDPRTTFVRKVTDAHHKGKKRSINLCKLKNVSGSREVNSRVSGAYSAMTALYKTTKNSSLKSSGSFRTYSTQKATFAKFGSGRAAHPGYSNHEMGYAIDWNLGSSRLKEKISSCKSTTRFTSSTDPYGSGKNRWFWATLSKWFCENSGTYKLYRGVHNEPWHMDPFK